jgi:hypothetical protein
MTPARCMQPRRAQSATGDRMPLNIEPNIASPDEFYEALLAAHRDLTPDESQRLNARLVLLLANHVGDLAVLRDALDHARGSVRNRMA